MSEINIETSEQDVTKIKFIQQDIDQQYARQDEIQSQIEVEIEFEVEPEVQSTDKNNKEDCMKQEDVLQKRQRKKTLHYVANFPDVEKKKLKKKPSIIEGIQVEPKKTKKIKVVSVNQIVLEIPKLDEEFLPWQIQLPTLSNLLMTLLSAGLPKLLLLQDPTLIKQQIQELHVNLDSTNPQPIKIIQKLIAPLIENSDYYKSDLEITKDCAEFIKTNADIEVWPENILSILALQELVVSMKDKKNYQPKTIDIIIDIEPKFQLRRILQQCGSLNANDEQMDDLESYSTALQAQEIIDQDMLSYDCTQQEFQNNRRVRKYLKRLIDSLYKLINLIQKYTKKEQIIKIEEAFKQYVDVKSEKIKLLKDKVKKSPKQKEEKIKKIPKEKEEKQQSPKIKESKKIKTPALLEKKNIVNPNQQKLTSMNLNFTIPQMQKEKILSEPNIEPDVEHTKLANQEHKNFLTVSPLPNVLREETPKKSQFSILNFFNTKDKKHNVLDKPQIKIEIFKCLGSKSIGSCWESDRELKFERMLQNQPIDQFIQLKDFLHEREMEIEYQKHPSKERKVHIYIFDSKKILRGIKFNKRISLTSFKQPFKKDENLIDYEIDSEDEMQELYAENIANSQKDDEEEPDQVSESDDEFVVSDGHLSMEEFSDKEDFKQRAQDLAQNDTNQPGQDLALKAYSYFINDQNQTQQEIFQQYKMIKISEDLELPIKTKKTDDSKSSKFFNREENMNSFLSLISGSFLPMLKIAQIFIEVNTTCSKYCAEKKLKEIAEKKRGEAYVKERWIIRPEILLQYGISEEQNTKMMHENEAQFLQNKKQKSDKKKLQEIESQVIDQEGIIRFLKNDELSKITKTKKCITPQHKLSDDIIKPAEQVSTIEDDEQVLLKQD